MSNTEPNKEPRSDLVSWVTAKVEKWENHRNTHYMRSWQQYYRLWRGIWSKDDSTRKSERSRIIVPALAQSIEASVSEIEEAVFSKDRWFIVSEEANDEQKVPMDLLGSQLLDDLDNVDVVSAVSEAVLNGAIYGTIILKLVVEDVEEVIPEAAPILGTEETYLDTRTESRTQVKIVPVDIREFVIDPAAKSVDTALGCAHVMYVPRHTIIEKIAKGAYKDVDLGEAPQRKFFTFSNDSRDTVETADVDDQVKITEWHGKVPRSYLEAANKDDKDETLDEALGTASDNNPDDDLVEAIVTIANDSEILKATRIPFVMKDRSFIAAQYDTVPNKFYGRGIAEKGFNVQKALDAETRARIDALAFSVYPMMGIDGTRMINNDGFDVYPGKSIVTNGPPQEILYPIKFPPPDTQSYKQTAEFERQVQMGTGAIDSAAPVGVSPRNATASGMSMMLAGMLKRSKRTMRNIEKKLILPLVHKVIWRYMQFSPDRYPIMDYRFRVNAALGIMSRELEQQQMISLLQVVPPNTPPYWALVKGIINNTSFGMRDELSQEWDQFVQQAMQPPQPPPPTLGEQAQMERVQSDKKFHDDKMRVAAGKLKLQQLKEEHQQKHLDQKLAIEERKAIALEKLQEASASKQITAGVLDLVNAENVNKETEQLTEEVKAIED